MALCPWGTSNNEHSGRHLPAEIAISVFSHVPWQILADALAIAISDTQALHLLCRRFYALAGRLHVGINFRLL